MTHNKRNHPLVSAYIQDRVWALSSSHLRQLRSIAEGYGDLQAVQFARGERKPEARTAERFGSTGVIHLIGPIFRYANVFDEMSGATSVQRFALDLQTLLEDPKIDRIILNINSPGGEADGIHELSERIFASRESKEIVAYVGGAAASGGYWIASAAERIVADRTATLGSIGVVIEYWDESKVLEGAGFEHVQIVSDVSPDKRVDFTDDEGRKKVQEYVDLYGEIFVEAVAKHRGISTAKVKSDFGRGFTMLGEKALAAGMVNEIGSFHALLQEKSKPKGGRSSMDESKVETEKLSASDLKARHPEAAEAIALEARQAEATRFQNCFEVLERAQCVSIHEEMKSKLFDMNVSDGDLAKEIVGRQAEMQQGRLQSIEEDGRELSDLGDDASHDESEVDARSASAKHERAAAIAGFANRQNGGTR